MSRISKSCPIRARVLTAASFSVFAHGHPMFDDTAAYVCYIADSAWSMPATKRDKLNLASAASEPRL